MAAERWHSTSSLAGLPGMPGHRSIRLWGEQKGWKCRFEGRLKKWLERSLPPETQRALQDRRNASSCGQQQSEASSTTESTEGASRRPRPLTREPLTPPRRPSRAPSAAGEAVADARLEILAVLERWLEDEQPSHLIVALTTWAEHYNNGLIDVTPETRALIKHVGRTQLGQWRNRRRKGGWSGLIPNKRGVKSGRGQIASDPKVRETILALLLDRPHSSPKFIREFVAARFAPERVPSTRATQRYLQRWKVIPENERLLSQIEDPDKHRSRRMPAPGDAAADIVRLNQDLEVDSTSLDVLCTDGPQTLIAGLEVYARRPRVLVTPRDRTEGVIALTRRCLIDWGVCEVWRCDNGAAYVSRWMRRVIAELEITPDPCDPYTPDQKPFVERFIRTISHGLFQNLPGYKGHSIAEQQKLRARHKFASRLGMPDGELFSVSLSAAELQQRCDDWIEHVYMHSPHEGLDGRRTPFEVAAAWRRPVKRIPDERALDVLLYKSAGSQGGWASVGPKGIRVDNGQYLHEDLGPLTGSPEKVQVREDPTNYGRILVLDAESRFICWAVDPKRLGLDRQEIIARMKARARAVDKVAREWAREKKKTIRPETAQDEVIDAAKRRHGTVTMLPHRSADYEAAALDEAARAMEQRDADETPAPRKRAAAGGSRAATRSFLRKVGPLLRA